MSVEGQNSGGEGEVSRPIKVGEVVYFSGEFANANKYSFFVRHNCAVELDGNGFPACDYLGPRPLGLCLADTSLPIVFCIMGKSTTPGLKREASNRASGSQAPRDG